MRADFAMPATSPVYLRPRKDRGSAAVAFVSTTNTAKELGRLRLAGIGADAVAVAGQLGEALSGLVGRHRPVVDPLRAAAKRSL